MSENLINLNPRGEDQHRSNWRELGNFAHDETPVGVIDGANLVFTLANAPKLGTLIVVKSGLRLQPIVDFVLAINATTRKGEITFTVAPAIGTWLSVDYRF